jgi:hypothetical protein
MLPFTFAPSGRQKRHTSGPHWPNRHPPRRARRAAHEVAHIGRVLDVGRLPHTSKMESSCLFSLRHRPLGASAPPTTASPTKARSFGSLSSIAAIRAAAVIGALRESTATGLRQQPGSPTFPNSRSKSCTGASPLHCSNKVGSTVSIRTIRWSRWSATKRIVWRPSSPSSAWEQSSSERARRCECVPRRVTVSVSGLAG